MSPTPTPGDPLGWLFFDKRSDPGALISTESDDALPREVRLRMAFPQTLEFKPEKQREAGKPMSSPKPEGAAAPNLVCEVLEGGEVQKQVASTFGKDGIIRIEGRHFLDEIPAILLLRGIGRGESNSEPISWTRFPRFCCYPPQSRPLKTLSA